MLRECPWCHIVAPIAVAVRRKRQDVPHALLQGGSENMFSEDTPPVASRPKSKRKLVEFLQSVNQAIAVPLSEDIL